VVRTSNLKGQLSEKTRPNSELQKLREGGPFI